MPLAICIDATSFHGGPRLQALRIHWDTELQLQPGSLTQLTALSSLNILGCGLRRVPADVASLNASLCELNLRSNSIQIDSATVASILQCSKLTMLNLQRANIERWTEALNADPDYDVWGCVQEQINKEGYVPARFSSESVQLLTQLPLAYYKLHGRDLELIVTDEYFCDHNSDAVEEDDEDVADVDHVDDDA